jgi:hypothetical protein
VSKLVDAKGILAAIGMPKAQTNDRSAYVLLALANLREDSAWAMAQRNTSRVNRPANSPYYCYQLTDEMLRLIQAYGTEQWQAQLGSFVSEKGTLIGRYKQQRDIARVPVMVNWQSFNLSAGEHNVLQKAIVEEFAPRFASGAEVLLWTMPKTWKIYVTAFPDRKTYKRFVDQLAWETEVWIAECPDPMIHLNGDRFLGPRKEPRIDLARGRVRILRFRPKAFILNPPTPTPLSSKTKGAAHAPHRFVQTCPRRPGGVRAAGSRLSARLRLLG